MSKREITIRASGLFLVIASLIVALTAIEHWQADNLPAAIAGAGWAITLLALYAPGRRSRRLPRSRGRRWNEVGSDE